MSTWHRDNPDSEECRRLEYENRRDVFAAQRDTAMSNKPRPRLKIVCMCRGGNTRSVAMKMILNRYLGHSTLACGMDNNDEDARRMLFEWADAIVILHPEFAEGVMPEFRDKMLVFDVGDDVWGNPFDEALQLKIAGMLNDNPIPLNYGRVINLAKVSEQLRRYREKIDARQEPEAV